MAKIVDTHCHIYSSRFSDDLSTVIERARSQGITKILMPNIDKDSIDPMLSLERDYPGFCIPMMGLHPCSVGNTVREQLRVIDRWFSDREFIAVGEIGLDLYWDKTTLKDQLLALEHQFELAISSDLPVVIHCREAFEELIGPLRKYSKKGLKAVLHCFTGSESYGKECIDMGYYLGMGGVLTFKNGGLKEIVKGFDLDHLLLETDSPYLAPVPYRGKRNEPAFITEVAAELAKQKEIGIEEVGKRTTENADRVFKLASWNS